MHPRLFLPALASLAAVLAAPASLAALADAPEYRPLAQMDRYGRVPEAPYPYAPRPEEGLFQATVNSVVAVMGPADQRCWIEHQPASEAGRNEPDVGRGLLGAVIGGVLGHQIGGGTGRDLATAGGAVAGAVIGARSGRDNSVVVPARDVRRCQGNGTGTPAYWDVGYRFRGIEHQVQMSHPPGGTITVNSRGEPRQ